MIARQVLVPLRMPAPRAPVTPRAIAGALALLVALGLAFSPATALAQDKGKCGDGGKGGTNYEIIRGPDGKKIFRIKTGFCIEGKVPKPSVIYVLNASTINYEWETLKQDFLPRTLEAVERNPF